MVKGFFQLYSNTTQKIPPVQVRIPVTLPYLSCRALVYQGCITLVNVYTITTKQQHRVVFKTKLPIRGIFSSYIIVALHTHITSVKVKLYQ